MHRYLPLLPSCMVAICLSVCLSLLCENRSCIVHFVLSAFVVFPWGWVDQPTGEGDFPYLSGLVLFCFTLLGVLSLTAFG